MPDTIPHDAVTAAIHLTPRIQAVREELEATRHIPPPLVQAIADAGLFRLYKYGLERSFRDVRAAVQHAAGLPVHFESAGKVFLGLRPSDVGW